MQIYDGERNHQPEAEPTATPNSEDNHRSENYQEQASMGSGVDSTTVQDLSAKQQKDITERDVENFLSNEKLTPEEKQKTHSDAVSDFKPEVGM